MLESEPTRPPQMLLAYTLAGSVDPNGVENNRVLEGGGRAAGNIGSAATQVCEIIGRVCVLVTRATKGSRQHQAQSLQAGGLLDHIFGLKCILSKIFWLEKSL
jgi:hypothetical protein